MITANKRNKRMEEKADIGTDEEYIKKKINEEVGKISHQIDILEEKVLITAELYRAENAGRRTYKRKKPFPPEIADWLAERGYKTSAVNDKKGNTWHCISW